MKKIFQLVAILVVLLVMASCAQAPTPIYVVVTSTPLPATQTPFVIVVTATPTPPLVPIPTPAYPTYSKVVSTYPAGVELSCTNAEVSNVTPDGKWVFTGGLVCPGKSQLTVEAGATFTIDELLFGKSWRSYGARITVMKTATIDGKIYRPGSKLTVDKDLNWIQVSSWD